MYLNISYHALRRLLGELGILLPVVLFILNGVQIEKSISHYYYTQAGTVFSGVLIAFGLFLFTYRGHPKDPHRELISDNTATNLAGFLAMATALIPTAFGADYLERCVHVLCHNNQFWRYTHLACAAGFLFIMGWMAIYKFTLGQRKGKNHWCHPLYRTCGYIVWGSLVAMAIYLILRQQEIITFPYGIFYGETIALWAFGVAWLVKGDASKMMVIRLYMNWLSEQEENQAAASRADELAACKLELKNLEIKRDLLEKELKTLREQWAQTTGEGKDRLKARIIEIESRIETTLYDRVKGKID